MKPPGNPPFTFAQDFLFEDVKMILLKIFFN
jgi:hypothetical protein